MWVQMSYMSAARSVLQSELLIWEQCIHLQTKLTVGKEFTTETLVTHFGSRVNAKQSTPWCTSLFSLLLQFTTYGSNHHRIQTSFPVPSTHQSTAIAVIPIICMVHFRGQCCPSRFPLLGSICAYISEARTARAVRSGKGVFMLIFQYGSNKLQVGLLQSFKVLQADVG